MLRQFLATTALASLLATGLYAQTATQTESGAEGAAAPLEMNDEGVGAGEGATSAVGGAATAQDATVSPDPATTAQDGVAPPMDDAAQTQQGTGGATAPGMANEGTEPAMATEGATTPPANMSQDAGAATDPAAGGEGTTTVVEPTIVQEGETDATDPVIVDESTTDATEPVVVEEGQTDAPEPALAGEGAAGATDPVAANQGGTGDALMEGWSPVEFSAVSADQLIGANIVTHENETIATIEDVLISDTGQVQNLVARFGGFLGFGSNRILLEMEEVEFLQQEGAEALMVRSDMTPESIENRPEYNEEATQ